jgi:hypothetical protein
MANMNSYKSLININEKSFESKNKKIIYLIPLMYYMGIMFIGTFLYVMGIISKKIYTYLIIFGGVLYFIRVIHILYTEQNEPSLAKKTVRWTEDNVSKRLRKIIPDKYFQCPKDCRRKK